MDYSYNFPAVRGIQAGTEYYIGMIPYKLLSKMFITNPNEILPEYRAQRKINYSRVPIIKDYIIKNRESYVFSALAASIDGDFEFISFEGMDLGVLKVSMDSVFLINDGQHRKTAIDLAIEEDQSLGDETIPVVFFKDKGLKRSQQMFTDLNKHAVNTSKSLNTLYDSNDPIAILTREVIRKIDFFDMYTDKESDTLGKYSKNLFTLNNFYQANVELINGININKEVKDFVLKFWILIQKNVVEWNDLKNKIITKKSLRENYIITQGVVLQAFGKLGNFLFKNNQYDLKTTLKKINNINWLRSNRIWENRTLINGKVVKSKSTINLTYLKIKELLNLPLNDTEMKLNRNIHK